MRGGSEASIRIASRHQRQVQTPAPRPELNAIERLWAYLKSHYLSNRVYADEAEIDAALRKAWNALTVERIMSVTKTGWGQLLD